MDTGRDQAEFEKHWTTVILNEALFDVYERTSGAQSRSDTNFLFFFGHVACITIAPITAHQYSITLSI